MASEHAEAEPALQQRQAAQPAPVAETAAPLLEAPLTRGGVLALQRSAGNRATTRLVVQRLTAGETETITKGVAAIQQDAEALKGRYSVAGEIEKLAAKGNAMMSQVKNVLGMAVILHANAATLRGLVEAVGAADRADAVALLFRQLALQPWAKTNLVQAARYDTFAKNPSSLEEYCTFVLDHVTAQWSSASEAERGKLVGLFDHSKGYDTSYDDIQKGEMEKLLAGLEEEGGGGGEQQNDGWLVSEWAKRVSNSDPFTNKPRPTGTGSVPNGKYASDRYSKATADEKKTFWVTFLTAFVSQGKVSWSEPGPMQTYLDGQMQNFVAELAKLAEPSIAVDAPTFLGDITELF